MRCLLLVVVCACGSKPAPAPVSNTASSSTEPATPTEGSAKVIQRHQTGGVVELVGDRGAAMKDADEEMGAHCGPNNYSIVQEGEEAVADPNNPAAGRTQTAWRVHYRCN